MRSSALEIQGWRHHKQLGFPNFILTVISQIHTSKSVHVQKHPLISTGALSIVIRC